MKNQFNLFYLLFFFVSIYVSSCSSDDDNSDPCDSVICENGGVCDTGVCSCLEGFEGDNCEITKDIETVVIQKVTITDFPQTNNGNLWDSPFSGPDIYIQIDRGSTNLYFHNSFFEDAVNTNNYEFSISAGLDITEPKSDHTFSLWDYDSNNDDDLMSFATVEDLNGQLKSRNFPTTISIPVSNFSITLEIEYIF